MTRHLGIGVLLVASTAAAAESELNPVRIAVPINGHIHPAICVSHSGTIVVTYGRENHVDLRITRSTDEGDTWSEAIPFVHTVGKTYYPGSLTTLSDGRLLHCWNRWDTPTTQNEPRSVLYSLSDDEGSTWSDPQPFPRDPKVKTVIRHPVTELPPKQWLVSLWDRTFVFDPATAKATQFGDGRVHGLVPIVQTPKEHGKNNFGETKVAITLRGMISRRYSEVVFPVFLRALSSVALAFDPQTLARRGRPSTTFLISSHKDGDTKWFVSRTVGCWLRRSSDPALAENTFATASRTTTVKHGTACSSITIPVEPSTAEPAPAPSTSTTKPSASCFTTSTRTKTTAQGYSSCEFPSRSSPLGREQA
ncbi:MAG: exo-alpha-sialidase [Planctomycetaceae bacterium]|nr:exo-alpha-sialidase [Planctomycetales bacterium]MCB9926379.1 exo-alpha-sialidase [Planctomycetaceae bacterium]